MVMSGHSKWSKVKHQKATTDVVKGMAFTRAARGITLAVRQGGGDGDPNHNFHLRLAIEKARDVNMPKENIERAIEKGKGVGGEAIEQINYEGYAPFGVACVIEVATDNKQRTVAVIKNLLDRAGGTLASPGAVSYLFDHCAVCTIPKNNVSFDAVFEVAVNAGATDVVDTSDMFEVYVEIAKASIVKQCLLEKGIAVDNIEIIMKPKISIPLDAQKIQKIDTLISEIENIDDVQKVFTNAESI
jgi:YebC/PmpR family DNA-binding regulatory protein